MEEVSEKYTVEEAKKDTYKGRGEPLEWRIVKKEEKDEPRKWGEDCWEWNVLVAQRMQSAAKQKQAGSRNRQRGSEAAAKLGHQGKSDEEKPWKQAQ